VCEAGSVIVTPGSAVAPTECAACPAGTYCAGGEAAQLPCGEGTWDDDQGPATECVDKSPCPSGQEVADEGTATVDRTCEPCEAGTFSSGSHNAICTTWTECGATQVESEGPTAMSDRVCRDRLAPSVDAQDAAPTYYRQESAKVLAPLLEVAAPDSSTLASASVQLENFQVGEDLLSFSALSGIDGAFDDETGLLEFSGVASLADYRTLLRSVRYENSAEWPTPTDRALSFRVGDGVLTSMPEGVTIDLCPTTLAPIPRVVVNEGDPDLEEAAHFPPDCVDVTGDGCVLLNFLDGQMPLAFNAASSIDPGRCGPDDPELVYHWEIFFPVTVFQGAKYTSAGMTGYFDSHFSMQVGSLPDLGPTDLWRAQLTITSPVTGLSTVAKFRFGLLNSPLSLEVSTQCQSPANTDPCPIPAGAPVPPGTET
jgi:hypothetical protein